jgi:hypothetical protein
MNPPVARPADAAEFWEIELGRYRVDVMCGRELEDSRSK